MTQQIIKSLTEYKDGVLYWRNTKKGRRSDIVGSNDGGYCRVCIDYKRYQLHNLIWLYHYGSFPQSSQLDHIDGNPNNNTIENLRDVPQHENTRNRKLAKNNTSGYNCIFWIKSRNRWRAVVVKKDGVACSKNFINKKEAHLWQREESIKNGFHINHGEYR